MTESTPAYPEPQHQARRGAYMCRCGGPCFYCGQPIEGVHQHDHMPIPWRHGGRETVPACGPCHDLKDRRRPCSAWPPASQEAGAAGLSLSAAILGQMLLDIVADPDEPFDLSIDRDQALAVIQGCTTCEARVFAARLVCLVLDEAQHFAEIDEQEAA